MRGAVVIDTFDFVAVGEPKVLEPADCWVAAGTHLPVDIVGPVDAVIGPMTVLRLALAGPVVDIALEAGTAVGPDSAPVADAALVFDTAFVAESAADIVLVADTVPETDIAFGAAPETGTVLVAAEADTAPGAGTVLAAGTASLEAIVPETETEVEAVVELVVTMALQRISASHAELDSVAAGVAGAAAVVGVAAVVAGTERPAVVTHETVVAMEVHPKTSRAPVAAAVPPGNWYRLTAHPVSGQQGCSPAAPRHLTSRAGTVPTQGPRPARCC